MAWGAVFWTWCYKHELTAARVPCKGPEQKEDSQNPVIDGAYKLHTPPLAGMYWSGQLLEEGESFLIEDVNTARFPMSSGWPYTHARMDSIN